MLTIEDIKIKGTALDRRVKITDSLRVQIRKMHKGGFTYKSLAEMFGVSVPTIERACMTKQKLDKLRKYFRNRRMYHYWNKSDEERSDMNYRWNTSKKLYREKLLLVKISSKGQEILTDVR